MSELRREQIPVWCADIGKTATFPMIRGMKKWNAAIEKFDLPEESGLFVNYRVGRVAFPYLCQSEYGHETQKFGLDGIVLENEHLRATFAPGVGGKLWSLFDKDAGRELLFANHVFRPANLALRNAWTSGGVEWNCGAYTGHHPHTCDPMFTCLLTAEQSGIGTPVLRMYNFERIRGVVYQMDFYLPDGAKFLHCRMRVYNPAYVSTDMYWWSNIAVPSATGARNVVPADGSFTHDYETHKLGRFSFPTYRGVDNSYPVRIPNPIDHFYDIPLDVRPFTAHLGEDGYGLVQTSTSRLRGRKLFVWGQMSGGLHWQDFLSGDDGHGKYSDGAYCEIQCGLARTQYECLPMPPRTAWEWIEYYGAMSADPAAVHGDWEGAKAEVRTRLESMLPYEDTEKELADTAAMAHTPAAPILRGDGFAALENERRALVSEGPLCPHLDFGTTGKEQDMWLSLLRDGTLRTPESEKLPPMSYQRSDAWMALLRTAAEGKDRDFWLTHYELGCALFVSEDFDGAKRELRTSVSLYENAWNVFALAEVALSEDDKNTAKELFLRVLALVEDDVSMKKRAIAALLRLDADAQLYSYIKSLPEEEQKVPRIRFALASVCVRLDKLGEADGILNGEEPLVIPDQSEGESAIFAVWRDLEAKKAARDGRDFDPATVRIPRAYDFKTFPSM